MASSSEEDFELEERNERENPRGESGCGSGVGPQETQGGSRSTNPSEFECPSLLLRTYAQGPFDPKKPLSQFVSVIESTKKSGGTKHYVCHICNSNFKGSYTRVNAHLLNIPGTGVKVCKDLTLEEKGEMSRLYRLHTNPSTADFDLPSPTSTSSKAPIFNRSSLRGDSPTVSQVEHADRGKRRASMGIDAMMNNQVKEDADDAISKMFFANGIPFNVSRSPYYKEAMKKVALTGASYVPPGPNKISTSLLDKNYSKVNLLMEDMKATWVRTGCSLIMDGWTDIRHRPLINIIVTCPAGPYFLKAVDCSGKRKDADFQFNLLKDAINEIGEKNIVQVVTDAAAVCKSAGMLVQATYKHIFWTPCCVHALNNALKDIGKIDWVRQVVCDARDVQMFICNHHTSLALFRSFSKKEFLKPVETRYASYFILLERMVEVKEPLGLMTMRTVWDNWSLSKSDMGKKVKRLVGSGDFWDQVKYIVAVVRPAVDVIRYADTDSPNLGEIYETFDSMLGQMREAIRAHDPSLALYDEHILPIIHRRWEKMNNPLHMAAYAVNPKWYIPRPGRVAPIDDDEVKKGFMKAIKKMYSNEDARKLREEWVKFASLTGFSRSAREDLHMLAQTDPIGWWRLHGTPTPILRMLSIRLLSQVASSSAAERNWSTYSFIHSVKRNRLGSRRAEKLVAVHSALRLLDRKTVEYRETPAARWDVEPEEPSQIDEEERDAAVGLVGVPLEHMHLSASESDSDEDVQPTGAGSDDESDY